jgi:hypothetical protein
VGARKVSSAEKIAADRADRNAFLMRLTFNSENVTDINPMTGL